MYEPIIVLDRGAPRRTSFAAEPQLLDELPGRPLADHHNLLCYHLACYRAEDATQAPAAAPRPVDA